MRQRMLSLVVLIAVTVVLVPSDRGASAHPGGLDANGGHYNRKTGEYHVHRPRAAPPAATSPELQGLTTAGPRSAASGVPTLDPRVGPLIRLLARKGVITEAEASLLDELGR